MHFNFNFYSSLLLIFFVHGLVYALLLFRKSLVNETPSDKWLAIFLLLCIFYIAPWMLGFAGWYNAPGYRDFIFYTPFQHLFFIGPVAYFYIQSLLNPSFKFQKRTWLHFLPGFLYLLYSLIMVVTDKIILQKYYFLADGADRDFDDWYQYTGYLSMVIYFFFSLRYYNLYRKFIFQVISYADTVMFRWIKHFLTAFLLMLIVRFLFYLASFHPFLNGFEYVGQWWNYFSFAIIFYYIAITGYANSVQTKLPFRLNLFDAGPSLLLQPTPSDSRKQDSVEDAEIIAFEPALSETPPENDPFLMSWKEKIADFIQSEKAYEDPELSLTQLARQLNTNPAIISKVINQGFKLNFNDFINHYRIAAVKEKLISGDHKTQTLLGIAFDAGFNSKATFNRAFKKATGLSPKDWLARN